jgi:peroxiredoxin
MIAHHITFFLTLASIALATEGFVTAPAHSTFLPSTTSLASTSTSMTDVEVGYKIPAVTLLEGQADLEKPQEVNLAELIKGKKVAIFAVPGAFTPGCSKSHLPSFITAQDELKTKGVDLTICLATNDPYVMEVRVQCIGRVCLKPCFSTLYFYMFKKAWGRTSGGADAGIRFLSDSNGELTKALGLAMESPVMLRTKRFSLIAQDGLVTHYFSSAEESSNTWAPSVLAAL